MADLLFALDLLLENTTSDLGTRRVSTVNAS